MTTTTQTERLIRYLSTGRSITENVARSRFGIKNLSARISDLRAEGMCIYTNSSNGVSSYRIGTPNATMVKLAYSVAGSRPFGDNN